MCVSVRKRERLEVNIGVHDDGKRRRKESES